jgi:hypothetical protein
VPGLARVSSLNCGTNAGWFVDLMTSAICAALVGAKMNSSSGLLLATRVR